jgi:hypothetical protein
MARIIWIRKLLNMMTLWMVSDYLCGSGTSPRRTKKEMLYVSVNR